MSAVWLKLLTLLTILSCPALSGLVSSEVVWRDLGKAVTIQCRTSKPDQEYLTLTKGLSEEYEVLYKDGKSEKNTIHKELMGRLQLNGVFPNVDILIKNLTTNDTGPYWCVYKKFDVVSSKTLEMKGTGSVLLVVAGGPQQDSACLQHHPSDNNLVLVIVVICAALMLGIIVCFLIWIILKTKTTKRRTKKKPRHVTNNDVYEDMRGTIRR